MSRIHLLPPELASQIAAGEVVERPASAVKELVENALDAGATRVDVEIVGGGITKVAVRDDGRGMDAEDAALAVERHATSKLSAIADLQNVVTYGFRGEALPSIASVSRFRLVTRSAESDAATELRLEGGVNPVITPTASAVGTLIELKDLFFNVPARRKFLRSSNTESGHITEVLEAAAFARHDVSFTLTRDGRKVREWLRAPSRGERARAALQEDELAQCEGERGTLKVEAYLSRPERARAGAAGLRLFVNGRPIKDRALAVTVAQAYGSVLERGRYPRGIVYLELPPQLVDVNVHPQKTEVRFADARAVCDSLYRVLSLALAEAFALPAPAKNPWSQRQPNDTRPAWQRDTAQHMNVQHEKVQHNTPGAGGASTPFQGQTRLALESEPPRAAGSSPTASQDPWGLGPDTTESDPLQTYPQGNATSDLAALVAVRDSHLAPVRPDGTTAGDPGLRWANLRFVAQLRQTYLLCEAEDGFYVLDQHAAAERVTFDRLRRQYQSRTVPAQALLFPLTVDVSPEEADLIEERSEELQALGVDLRRRGPETVSIHAIPRLLGRASPERLVRDLLSEVTRRGGRGFSDAVDLALATMACHGSIRAGESLGAEEVKALLQALDQADFAGHCPHGRPVVTRVTWAELERKVGRR
ncbi:MAG: DNA mismatch repair endonuclease MutL [Polyangiaceae bacterium]|nr:DNA mismatch repair endonuclease MutL [Myxococcales bacterium]MCB9585851.1 DNA mismatch repair endonuclease MutL [Polyangiaceae bacterium]MCB9607220.1 DNA mismatch repair endonuclease MutL [Polyangiaceae bacterium]